MERRVTLGFGIAALALFFAGGAAWWNAKRYGDIFARVEHTHLVLDRLERVLTDILSMQASVRGFILTGSDAVLQPFDTGEARMTGELRDLRDLTADNPGQQARLDRAETFAAEARTVMKGRILARRTRGLDVAGDTSEFLRGQEAVESFRRIVAEIEDEERRILSTRLSQAREAERATVSTIWTTSALAISLVAAAGVLLRRDLRERRSAEIRMRHSEERLRLMIASVQDYAIVMLDPAGRIASWNASAESIHGYAEHEIAGQPFSRLFPEEAVLQGLPRRQIERAAAEGRMQDEGWLVRRDGSRFWASVTLAAMLDGTGKRVGFVKVTRDLTTQKVAAEKIQSLNEDLTIRASQLEAANRELEAFSYSVSHDLRAPLRHIDGFSHLLLHRASAALDPESRRFLGVISSAAKQMGALIDDLLAFSRIGRTPLRRGPVDQHRLVTEVIAEANYPTHAPHVQWDIGPLPEAIADASLLRQVWRNLLDNAVKYSGKAEHPQIVIRGRRDEAGNEAVFSVQDNGVGFDMTYADKLFGVFQRLHGPAEFEGTGIGLANVRRIVARHGGRTWAEGRVGAGATFHFSLPCAVDTAVPAKRSNTPFG